MEEYERRRGMPLGCKRKRRMDARKYEEQRRSTEAHLLHARTHALRASTPRLHSQPTFTSIPRPIASRLHLQLAPPPHLAVHLPSIQHTGRDGATTIVSDRLRRPVPGGYGVNEGAASARKCPKRTASSGVLQGTRDVGTLVHEHRSTRR